MENKELTYGQKAVGIGFNPSGEISVARVKQKYAEIIDELNELKLATQPGEIARLASIAITEAQTAQMWAVKALTFKE